MEETFFTFWEMVWENEVEAIVAIVEKEGLPKRCGIYWPL